MRLLLVRHGDTDFNTSHRFMGHSDIDLSTGGRRQIECVRDYLKGEKINTAYASDLARTITTASIITAGRNIDVVPCPELREMNYGLCEGMTFGEINDKYPQVANNCINFNLSLEFPEGDTFKDFSDRTVSFLQRLKKHKPTDTVLVVSHSGPLKALICHFLNIDMEHWWQIRIDTASVSTVDVTARGAILSRLNDTCCLKNINGLAPK
jgi:alpha-ribazole phosphatase